MPLRWLMRRVDEFMSSQTLNGDPDAVRKSYREALERAKQSAFLVCADLEASVFADSTVLASLIAALERGVHVTIVTGPVVHEEAERALADLRASHGDTFRMARLPKRPLKCPLVVDDQWVRISDPHPPIENGSSASHYAIMAHEPPFARRVRHEIETAIAQAESEVVEAVSVR